MSELRSKGLLLNLPEKIKAVDLKKYQPLKAVLPYASISLGIASVVQQLIKPGSSVWVAWAGIILAVISIFARNKPLLAAGGFILGLSAVTGMELVKAVKAIEARETGLEGYNMSPESVAVFARMIAMLPAIAGAVITGALWKSGGMSLANFTDFMELNIMRGIRGIKEKPESKFDVQVAPGIIVKGEDRFLHTMIVGTIGTGKTSRTLKPMIWQDLQAIKAGERIGITVIEPKGDFSADVAEMARSLGIPVMYLNPEDPNSPRFNPLEGDAMTAAEIMRTVLQSLFGKQEAFFRQAQEVAARNTVLLLKAAYGDRVDIKRMAEALRNEEMLKACLDTVERKQGRSSLTEYFRQEVLGSNKEKMAQHTLGLRLQLEDITGNEMLNKVLVGKSDINLDKHLEGGGVFVVNTAMGRLGKLGDVFGQFVMMHLQAAVFRRPGNEMTRPYHVLYVDEFPRYVNPDFERLLAIGRSFRCAAVLALQTTSQLLLESKPAFRDIVLENCRNKIILNLGSAEDAKRFAAEFGERLVVKRSRSYNRDSLIFLPLHENSIREDEKYEQRFNYTDMMEMPAFHGVVKVVVDGKPQPPQLVKLELSEWDKNRRRYQGKELSLPVEEEPVKEGSVIETSAEANLEAGEPKNEGAIEVSTGVEAGGKDEAISLEREIIGAKDPYGASKKKATLKASKEELQEERVTEDAGGKVFQLTILDEQDSSDEFFV
ncbi:type IV secretion system DNA-binding domain-containing protein [Moorella naiadis]|uniref:type IV secretory system conjugative DNA transfer family protein n=1 Tax=Moorella naiadis (nom. illeg.) TaxID=3093670 RepID=UPI003D9CA06C